MDRMIHSVIFFIMVLLHFHVIVSGEYYIECENITNERIFVESNKGCQFYVFCDGMDSFDGECDEGFYFSKEFQTCDPKEIVECRTSSSATSIGTAPTAVTPMTTVRPPTSSSSGLPTTLRTTGSTITSTSSTPLPSAPTTIGTASQSTSMSTAAISFSTAPITTTTEIAVPPFAVLSRCPSFDNPYQMVLVPHSKSCSDYFMCYHGKALPMHCSAMLQFNRRTGKCDYPENARCQIAYTPPKEQCQSHTTDLYPHPRNCNYYFYCRNGFLMLQQCPLFFGWDMERRSCVSLKMAKCYNRQFL